MSSVSSASSSSHDDHLLDNLNELNRTKTDEQDCCARTQCIAKIALLVLGVALMAVGAAGIAAICGCGGIPLVITFLSLISATELGLTISAVACLVLGTVGAFVGAALLITCEETAKLDEEGEVEDPENVEEEKPPTPESRKQQAIAKADELIQIIFGADRAFVEMERLNSLNKDILGQQGVVAMFEKNILVPVEDTPVSRAHHFETQAALTAAKTKLDELKKEHATRAQSVMALLTPTQTALTELEGVAKSTLKAYTDAKKALSALQDDLTALRAEYITLSEQEYLNPKAEPAEADARSAKLGAYAEQCNTLLPEAFTAHTKVQEAFDEAQDRYFIFTQFLLDMQARVLELVNIEKTDITVQTCKEKHAAAISELEASKMIANLGIPPTGGNEAQAEVDLAAKALEVATQQAMARTRAHQTLLMHLTKFLDPRDVAPTSG